MKIISEMREDHLISLAGDSLINSSMIVVEVESKGCEEL
jgi:hypothetical protein